MHKQTTANSIYHVMLPFLYVTKMYGFMSFSMQFVDRKFTKIKCKLMDAFITCIATSVYFYMFYRNISEPNPFNSSSALINKSLFFSNFIGVIIAAVGPLVFCVNRYKIFKIMKNMQFFDEKVRL
jgi:hypothetical protein